jgi:hypothetical protein
MLQNAGLNAKEAPLFKCLEKVSTASMLKVPDP